MGTTRIVFDPIIAEQEIKDDQMFLILLVIIVVALSACICFISFYLSHLHEKHKERQRIEQQYLCKNIENDFIQFFPCKAKTWLLRWYTLTQSWMYHFCLAVTTFLIGEDKTVASDEENMDIDVDLDIKVLSSL